MPDPPAEPGLVVDLCAGPGGWSEGLRMVAPDAIEIGYETDAAACATRAAAGHLTVRADIASVPLGPLAGKVEGLIASPPCTAFSQAGSRAGADEIPWLLDQIRRGDWEGHHEARPRLDPLVWLILEPGRWVEALRPRWVALEQVPPVLPLWRAYAHAFGELGYSCWAGVLCAADYGVPQTRERAILLARQGGAVGPPAATHTDQRKAADLFGLPAWVSMAEALPWLAELAGARVGFPRRDDRGDSPDGYRERDWRDADEPAFALTERGRSWVVRMLGGENGTVRPITEPAPTMAFGHDSASAVVVNTGRDWKPGGSRADAQQIPITDPAPAIDGKGRWFLERPATTVAGDSRIQPPGHKQNASDPPGKYDGRAGENAIRVTVEDALVLQSFRRDYPVWGNQTKRFEQVGNAVPPRLAAHVLAVLMDRPPPAAPDTPGTLTRSRMRPLPFGAPLP